MRTIRKPKRSYSPHRTAATNFIVLVAALVLLVLLASYIYSQKQTDDETKTSQSP